MFSQENLLLHVLLRRRSLFVVPPALYKMQVVPFLSLAGFLFIEHKPNHLHTGPAIPWLPGGPNPSCCLSAGPSVGQIRGFYPGDFLTQMPAADNAEDCHKQFVSASSAVKVHSSSSIFFSPILSSPPPPPAGKLLQISKAVLTYSVSSWPRGSCVNSCFLVAIILKKKKNIYICD